MAFLPDSLSGWAILLLKIGTALFIIKALFVLVEFKFYVPVGDELFAAVMKFLGELSGKMGSLGS